MSTLATKALAHAVAKIGEQEHPAGSNRCGTTKEWGVVGPWCAMFVSRCYIVAGSELFDAPYRYESCPILQHAAQDPSRSAALFALEYYEEAEPGDIVLYCWNGTGIPEHTGLLEEWAGPLAFRAIEGNTGNAVRRRDRHVDETTCFIRVRK